jgi:hypothetical protein
MIPFLFLPAAVLLVRFPRLLIIIIATLSLIQSWALAMYREVELGPGILDPIVKLFTQGITLPAITTLSRMEAYRDLIPRGPAIVIIFLLVAVVLYLIWKPRRARPIRSTSRTSEPISS